MKFKLLIIILVAGFILRVINISENRLPLYGDELTMVYDSYSLYKTGHDQLGNFLPLTFEMGAGRPAGYVYFSIPFVALFGPGGLGVRLLSVISGLGIILLLYLIGKKIFSPKVGLAASLIAAFSPWAISLSMVGFEANFALFLSLLGIYFFIKAFEKPVNFVFSALAFGLTLHTYPTYKVIFVLFLPLLFWYVFTNTLKDAKYLGLGLIVFFLFGILTMIQTFTSSSETRFLNINVFSNQEIRSNIEQKINFERGISQLPPPISRIFLNKGVEYTKIVLENYFQNFSLDFLLLHGDRNPRHNMATQGQLFLMEIILIIIGLLNYWTREKRTLVFLTLWLLIAPISTSFIDLPHNLRSSFMLPALILLSSLGLVTLFSFRRKIFIIAAFIIFSIQFVNFSQKLYFLAPVEYGSFWSYPAKLASEMANENKNKFDYIILSDKIDNMEFAYPVYAKVDPKDVISQNQNKASLNDYNFKKFGNVYIGFIPNSHVESFLGGIEGSVLYIGDPTMVDYLEGYETIQNKDGMIGLVLKKVNY